MLPAFVVVFLVFFAVFVEIWEAYLLFWDLLNDQDENEQELLCHGYSQEDRLVHLRLESVRLQHLADNLLL